VALVVRGLWFSLNPKYLAKQRNRMHLSAPTPVPSVLAFLQVLLDGDFARKVLPADGTSGVSALSPMGPKSGGVAIWHDAQGLAGRTATSIGRRPAPFLALCRRLLMSAPADV
jgi:hypothetical protein